VSTERTEPSPQAKSLYLPWWYWVANLANTGVVILMWFVLGPSHPIYVLAVIGWTWGLLPGAAGPAVRILPRRWFRVSTGERILHRLLGVGIFDWLLERSAYNRHIARPMRGFDGTRAGLPSLELSLRSNASAHGSCFAIHVLLATVALSTGHPWGTALWILLPGVVIHVYPVLLQRSIMLRIQPLLDRSGSCNLQRGSA
jgi:hypothetical protein